MQKEAVKIFKHEEDIFSRRTVIKEKQNNPMNSVENFELVIPVLL